MRNKLFVADNALASPAAANRDEYFARDPHYNFIDLDVVAAGAMCASCRRPSMRFGTANTPIRSPRWPRRRERRTPPRPLADGGDDLSTS